MAKYSLETKLNAVHDFLNGVKSYKKVADKHNVDTPLLKGWVRRFEDLKNKGILYKLSNRV